MFSNNKHEKIYYLDSSKFYNWVVDLFDKYFNNKIEQLKFTFDNLIDDNDTNINYKIVHNDYREIWLKLDMIIGIDDKIKNGIDGSFVTKYIKKTLYSGIWTSYGVEKSIREILIFLNVISKELKNSKTHNKGILFIDRRIYMDILTEYASNLGIQLIPIDYPVKSLMKNVQYTFKNNQFLLLIKSYINYMLSGNRKINKCKDSPSKSSMIILDQVMQLFRAGNFWLSNNMISKYIIFVSKTHKVNQKVLDEIKDNEMQFISLSRNIATNLDVPYFLYTGNNSSGSNKNISNNNKINQLAKNYFNEKMYWNSLFSSNEAMMYGTHEKWSSHVIPAFSAMNDRGGISFLWQTSYYEFPNPSASVFSDIYFCYSSSLAAVELSSQSKIKYIVSVGYIFDHQFDRLKSTSISIRKKIQKHGAKKIVSFFDGGSALDDRWSYGNRSLQEDYEFWLEKILTEKWLGLIIKSKKPGDLLQRLGKISVLLNEAIKTGRCCCLGEANHYEKDLETRPALAAMASDIAIHQRLDAGSAGVEAILSGTPTLMYDRYKLKDSQFYGSNQNNIVFNQWNEMWDALIVAWENSSSNNLGDWTTIIDNIDPYRDGKASERMIYYIESLQEGLSHGINRDEIMEEVSQRYTDIWGEDKVIKCQT